ncbi:hypothetical protein BDW02DRAFT_93602 [Decorospora gaudefroyi]|uniref:DUF1772-domain-containing protein n=1 Tax=Decorospora gaudefroyi TaxID=184978 RepID=A0A6A5K3G2_9PLEO|nr:hypothetical protein BDW02DRAFT_93602 [Decorospora gaudefroyi]
MSEAAHVTIVLQAIATIAPALYTGFTFAYSHVAVPPLTAHAPPRLLAKQWLQAYQFAPIFVAPLILLGTSSNALLAYLSLDSPSSSAAPLYAVAALANACIIPYTALYMEPRVNGAAKWKARELLREDGFRLKGRGGQGTNKDTASEAARKWAEQVDMKTIVNTWAETNAWRYVVTAFATLMSVSATVARG